MSSFSIGRGYTIAILMFVTVVLGACGGGNDSGAQADGQTLFTLFPANFFNSGYSESYTVAGSDNQGQQFNGRYVFQTQPQALFQGATVTPVITTLTINNENTGASSTIVSTDYYQVQNSSLQLMGAIAGAVTLQPLGDASVPQFAMTGEFGAIGTFLDNAGNRTVSSWRLDSAANGQATFIQLQTTTNPEDEVASTAETELVINTAGERLSAVVRINNLANGVALVLSGSRE
ncbi:MAG: hypothetical protein AAF404_04820 [Pseudomonadota bacterium]